MPAKRSDKPKRAPKRPGPEPLTRWNVSKPKVKTSLKEYGKPAGHYKIRLYVAGSNLNSIHAISAIERFCADYLSGRIEFEVVDLYQQPQLAKQDEIVAVPCLVRIQPPPKAMYVGRMDDCDTLLLRLGIDPGSLKH